MITLTYLRSFRVLNYAVFDFVVSFIGVLLISPLLTKAFQKVGLYIPTTSWLLLAIPLSIPIHMLFDSYTPMTKNFLDPSGSYVLKLVILGLTVAAVLGMKRVNT